MIFMFDNSSFIKADAEFVYEFAPKNLAPLFRKKFFLGKTGDAKLFVCGLGYAYYYINGIKVSDDLFTAPVSNYNFTLWYNVYDVSHLLKQGENTIAVICGNGWYNETVPTSWKINEADWRDNPKFILSLTVDGEEILVSDGSWKCKKESGIIFNQLRMGEYFDARIYDEKWICSDYDDSGWENAVIDINTPGGVFRECLCEPIRECEVYKPVSRIKNGENSYVYDLGQNISGYVRISVCGRSGEELTIRYAECLDSENRLEYHGMDTYYCKDRFQTDKIILSGERVTWSPRFAYHGFRYIEVSGLSDVENTVVEGVFVHQAVERRVDFSCSDEYFNKMYRCAVMSSWSNMFYMPTDCPTREKFGWANDAQSSCEQFLTNFKAEKLLTKWHRDIKDAMRESGELPGIIPTAGWGYHWGNGPVSDGILFEIPYRVFLHTGDSSLLTGSIDYFVKYLSYLEGRMDGDSLVDFGLDDWAAPGNIHVVDVKFINAVLISSFYKTTHLAMSIAKHPDAEKYLGKSEEMKALIKSKYIDKSGACSINEQCSVSMLIYYGIYDELEPLKAQLAKLLSDNGFHLKCGMVGMRRILHALTKCGLTDYGVKLLKAEGYPGYKVWMDGGATTLWEKWDVNVNADSKNHHMYSDFASWLIKTFAGVSINEQKCGELEFVLNPCFTSEVSSVDFDYDTVSGKISVSWIREGGKVKLSVIKDDGVKLIYNGKYLNEKNNHFEIGEKE